MVELQCRLPVGMLAASGRGDCCPWATRPWLEYFRTPEPLVLGSEFCSATGSLVLHHRTALLATAFSSAFLEVPGRLSTRGLTRVAPASSVSQSICPYADALGWVGAVSAADRFSAPSLRPPRGRLSKVGRPSVARRIDTTFADPMVSRTFQCQVAHDYREGDRHEASSEVNTRSSSQCL